MILKNGSINILAYARSIYETQASDILLGSTEIAYQLFVAHT